MITLRGHHLICLVAFGGQGYSAKFSRNFKKLRKLYLSKPHHKVKVITTVDQACRQCPHLVQNKCTSLTDGPNARIMALDKKALKLLGIKTGVQTIGAIHQKLRQLKKASLISFCKNCSWHTKTHCPEVIMGWINTLPLIERVKKQKNP